MKITQNMLSGIHKDTVDVRDFLIKSFFVKEEIPNFFDLTDKMTPVRNQLQDGSCAGFAGTACKEYLDQIDYNKFVELSPRYLYEEARELSGHAEGTSLRAIMKILVTKGVCLETYWPYQVPQEIPVSDNADENAVTYKIKAYARILNLEELKHALVEFGAILAGIYVYKSIRKTGLDGIVPTPNKAWPSNWKPLGGHAITFCGFDNSQKLVKFKNSWGKEWGQGGYGYLTYQYIRDNMLDCYSMVDVPESEVEKVGALQFIERDLVWI